MQEQRQQNYDLGEFRLDAAKRLLTNAIGETVPLTPKVFDLLLYLVENRGRLVEKDELMSSIWSDTIVEESNLTQNISTLRRVLGEKRGEHRYIATIPGRGYKFVAQVHEIDGNGSLRDRERENSAVNASSEREAGSGSNTHRIVFIGFTLIAIVAVGLGFFAYFNRNNTYPTDAGPTHSIAVLPFKPLVAEDRDEVLEIGMADTLIARLGSIRGLIVRPLSSVRTMGESSSDSRAAGGRLGVEAVLEGSIQRWGEKLRVNVRLINVADGASLWTGTFDENGSDIFAVQDAIASKVTEALKIHVGTDRRSRKDRPTDVEAYRFYLQGRYHAYKLVGPEVRKGIEYYKKAIDQDPLYALAYAGMADAYRTLPINSDVPPKDALPLAKSAAEKALEIDDQLADAHVVLGWVASWYDWDSAASENEFKKAIELSPDNPDAHRGYSGLLTVVLRHDEAVAEMQKARELDPLSLVTGALEGQALFYAGRDQEAIERLKKTFEIDPNFWIARINLAKVYIRQGKYDEALTELRTARENSSGNSETLSLIGYTFARAGRREDAVRTVAEMKVFAGGTYVPPYNIAMVYNGLGDADETFRWLEKGLEDRDVRMRLLNVDHKWEPLRRDPRWAGLVQRVNL